MHIPRRRAARIALGTIGVVVVALALAQLLLPKLAAQRVRDRIGRYGVVVSASVKAFPAIELLWGSAQSASVTAGHLNMGFSQASELLWEARGVHQIDMNASTMRLGPLTIRNASTEKRGEHVYIQGSVTPADLRGILPGIVGMEVLGRVAGGIEVRVKGNLFGTETSVEALLSTQGGKLIAQPQGLPFAGSVKLTLFSASHMYLQNFALTPVSSAGENRTYSVKIWATLR